MIGLGQGYNQHPNLNVDTLKTYHKYVCGRRRYPSIVGDAAGKTSDTTALEGALKGRGVAEPVNSSVMGVKQRCPYTYS